jgi:hypothetical protein
MAGMNTFRSMVLHLGAITFPEHFWDGFGGAVLGALSGGALAILGAYLANRYLADREADNAKKEEKQDLAGALRLVRYELAALCASIDSLLKYKLFELPTAVTDAGFRSVQLTIARHHEPEYMNSQDRAHLVNAYELLAFVTRDVKLLQSATQAAAAGTPPGGAWPKQVVDSLTSTLGTLKSVDDRLRQVLVENLKEPEA